MIQSNAKEPNKLDGERLLIGERFASGADIELVSAD